MLKKFREELKSKTAQLREDNLKAREERKTHTADFLKEAREKISSETEALRKEFSKEHQEIIAGLKVSSGDLKKVLADSEKSRTDSEKNRKSAAPVGKVIAKKSPKTAVVKPHVKKEHIKEESKAVHEVKKEDLVQEVTKAIAEESNNEQPTHQEVKVVEEVKKEYTNEQLKKKILALVKKHADDGIRVGEMEEAIGVSKLILGRLAKEMYEEEEIGNENSRYFPIQ